MAIFNNAPGFQMMPKQTQLNADSELQHFKHLYINKFKRTPLNSSYLADAPNDTYRTGIH